MIVITAPTGAIGGKVLARLLDAGEDVRVVVRDPARLAAGARERVEIVQGSHGDPDVVGKAFDGADAVFWLVPPDHASPSLEATYLDFTRPAVAAIAACGVPRVVGVSALGRGTPQAARAGHVTASLAMDDLLAGSGAAYRALALPSFMDNTLHRLAEIRDAGVYAAPISGDRALPACSTGDIADVAAALLRDASWTEGGEVPLLGPEDLTPRETAAILGDVLGRPVRYEHVPAEEFKAGFLARGASEAVAQGMLDMMLAKEAGLDGAVPRTERTATPTAFRTWCEKVLKPLV
ncbi:NAD(P)H-binding protein [Actinomadura parmotrematis]|uniref:NAD(P)H-binding protein n=1 Tax=Actinomadura parmotrematis TaxID=2864039 RepID=A0ABS7FVE7_9ACTN|nr:NAD(P)H-binding protein [Actinomadura parmotrematis]MBW8484256.1 NAD(P)H-binding protein [Actinomadura parmotrematis]